LRWRSSPTGGGIAGTGAPSLEKFRPHHLRQKKLGKGKSQELGTSLRRKSRVMDGQGDELSEFGTEIVDLDVKRNHTPRQKPIERLIFLSVAGILVDRHGKLVESEERAEMVISSMVRSSRMSRTISRGRFVSRHKPRLLIALSYTSLSRSTWTSKGRFRFFVAPGR
jgi:hypothetical protein